jgi:hypothetical protein
VGGRATVMIARNPKRGQVSRTGAIRAGLEAYCRNHPSAKVTVKRRDWASVHIRVIDPDFKGLDRVEREEAVWPFLDKLPEEAKADISWLILLTPQEVRRSAMNDAFEDPSKSLL